MDYELIAEGGANSLFRRTDGTVIRVSKHGVDPTVIADYWRSFWKPRLAEYLGDLRPIVDPRYGPALLINEVGNSQNCNEIVAEFKPKWLSQSPKAPEDAKSCRTCAIKTMRNQPLYWCSLDLAALDDNCIRTLSEKTATQGHSKGVARILKTSNLIEKIAYWQAELREDIYNCMTLRDCTILIEYRNQTQDYHAFVVDLDPKEGTQKLQKWMTIEEKLQPYYLKPSPICRLSRQ